MKNQKLESVIDSRFLLSILLKKEASTALDSTLTNLA